VSVFLGCLADEHPPTHNQAVKKQEDLVWCAVSKGAKKKNPARCRNRSIYRPRARSEPPISDPHDGWCGSRSVNPSGDPIRCFHRFLLSSIKKNIPVKSKKGNPKNGHSPAKSKPPVGIPMNIVIAVAKSVRNPKASVPGNLIHSRPSCSLPMP
jgi:hypothetical protein